MAFTRKSLNRFSDLYFKEFGERLSEEEVLRKAEYLVEVYRTAYGMPSIGDTSKNDTYYESSDNNNEYK